MKRLTASCLVCGVLTVATPVLAQESPPQISRTSIDGIEILTGLMEFDLNGTGLDIPIAIRASRSLTDRLALEFGATLASPHQQFGPSTFAAPEVQLSYSWRFGRLRPFVSGGGGAALIRSDVRDAQWRPTFSAGGGARIQLSDTVYAIGEMRLRGISTRVSANTAEWLGGIGWMLR